MSKARVKANARRLHSTVQRVEQQVTDLMPDRRMPRAGGGAATAYCRLSSSLGPATGTWPSLTPTSQASIDVYIGSGSAPVKIGTFTVYNYRNVTWATAKTTFLSLQGGTWNVVDQDC